MVSKHHAYTSFEPEKKVEPALTAHRPHSVCNNTSKLTNK